MEKKPPDFLTRLFKSIPQNSEFSEAKGWGDTSDDPRFNGWDSSSGSSISQAKTNGWLDEPPESDYLHKPKIEYKGWGSGSDGKGRSSGGRSGGWTEELPEGDYNGWDVPESEATNNHEKPKDGYNGWGWGSDSGGKGWSSGGMSCGWMDEPREGNYNGCDVPGSNPINKKAEIDVGSLPIADLTPLKIESWAPPPLPSAPPLPDGGFSENPATNAGGNGDSSCLVCWEAPVEGACVPCGHMASCMKCLHEIETRNGSCPICRSKIDKIIRIYAISTK